MRIGTIFAGRVDGLGEESIQTKFLLIGLPIVPLESYYALRETVNGVEGFRIPFQGKSVLLGYLRFWAVLPTVIFGIMAFVKHGDAKTPNIVGAVLFGAVWAGLTFFAGGLSEEEKLRRLILKQVTGTGAPPDLLPSDVKMDIREKLQARWSAVGNGTWSDALATGTQADLLPLSATLAAYSDEPALAQKGFAQLAVHLARVGP